MAQIEFTSIGKGNPENIFMKIEADGFNKNLSTVSLKNIASFPSYTFSKFREECGNFCLSSVDRKPT